MTHAETRALHAQKRVCTRLHEFSLTHTNCHACDTRAERVLNACQTRVALNLSLVCTVHCRTELYGVLQSPTELYEVVQCVVHSYTELYRVVQKYTI